MFTHLSIGNFNGRSDIPLELVRKRDEVFRRAKSRGIEEDPLRS